jgi:hypothetical protein
VQLFNDLKLKAIHLIEENSSTLLTAGGVIGVIGTGVLSGRAGLKAGRILEAADQEGYATDDDYEPPTTLEQVKSVGLHFAPPVVTGATTIAAVVMAHRMSAQKIAALTVAYSLAERNLGEYKDKVAEKLTGPKNQQIKDELAQEAVDRTPGSDKLVIVEGEVLCFDKATGRYFNSSMEQIRQAVNTTNAEIFNHGFTTLNFFYEELGLPPTTWAGEVGFDGDNPLDLDYTTTLAPGNRPCIAIDFKSMPKTESSGPKYA